jgi:hypothetical protein
MAKDHFLQQLERTMHLKGAPSHVDKPSEKTIEELELEQKKAELAKTKAEAGYWEDRRQANSTAGAGSGDEPVYGLASNQKKHSTRFVLPKGSRRPSWK